MKSLIRSDKIILKAVLDTNIFLSALIYKGNPAKVLELFENGHIEVVISPDVVPTTKVTVCRDPKDNMLLEACQKSQANFLITGDKDLLTLKAFKQTQILRPKEFLGNIKDL